MVNITCWNNIMFHDLKLELKRKHFASTWTVACMDGIFFVGGLGGGGWGKEFERATSLFHLYDIVLKM